MRRFCDRNARLLGALPQLTIGETWLTITVMDLKQIEAAMLELDAEDLTELTAWLKEPCAQHWDAQIAEDLESGRFDGLTNESIGINHASSDHCHSTLHHGE